MNSYDAKTNARKARFEERAAKARSESASLYERAHSMSQSIPVGQPILIGHHSEQRARNFSRRIHNTYGKAFALQDKAEAYARKATRVGTGGISSDDPDALAKLRASLEGIYQAQERMKAANKVIRTHKTLEDRVAALVALGFSTEQAADLVTVNVLGSVGFPPYALSNNSANARRIKARIAELEKRSQREDVAQEGCGYTYRECNKENRVMFVFHSKPDDATRSVLKRNAFKWSPSRGAWVRPLSNAGLWAAQVVRKALGQNDLSA